MAADRRPSCRLAVGRHRGCQRVWSCPALRTPMVWG